LEDILNKITSKPLSKLLSEVIILASETNEDKLKRWAKLELHGYTDDNSVLSEEDVVPKYRTLVGSYLDSQGRTILINDPNLQFIYEQRLRLSVTELEGLVNSNEKSFISPDRRLFQIINDNLHLNIHAFKFQAYSIHNILSAIHTELVDRLSQLKSKLKQKHENLLTIKMRSFHPKVIEVAGKLFEDGHYRSAILDTYIALTEAVKEKSGALDLDNTPLMQNVFSQRDPIIRLSPNSDAQLGYMWMFSGAVMGIRNQKAHSLVAQTDPQRALEWLAFASVLFRLLDEGVVCQEYTLRKKK
jgi:uncharacterized protein (TIGR02391 family)